MCHFRSRDDEQQMASARGVVRLGVRDHRRRRRNSAKLRNVLVSISLTAGLLRNSVKCM